MVTLKCHLTQDTFQKDGLNHFIYKICEHLKGEPAYRENSILVSDADKNGDFYICLGGDVNKENLIIDTKM